MHVVNVKYFHGEHGEDLSFVVKKGMIHDFFCNIPGYRLKIVELL